MADENKKPVTARFDISDIEKLKEIAEKKGLGYQSLLSCIVHLYVTGSLVDIDEVRKLFTEK